MNFEKDIEKKESKDAINTAGIKNNHNKVVQL